ncbi:MAG: hypothetical protein HY513_05435 [Candidatus Aenigmarchaeota archaeon]|nr:hypothetical protein [Candidatus Aenigmarchaeota archaeon]
MNGKKQKFKIVNFHGYIAIRYEVDTEKAIRIQDEIRQKTNEMASKVFGR